MIHVVGSDGSNLVNLGWAKKTGFNYTWCPREYYNENEKKENKSSKWVTDLP
jgi:hypothetical protein